MILAIALFLAVVFGAVGLVTGHTIAKHQDAAKLTDAEQRLTTARDLEARAYRLAYAVTRSPSAAADTDLQLMAAHLITQTREDTTN